MEDQANTKNVIIYTCDVKSSLEESIQLLSFYVNGV